MTIEAPRCTHHWVIESTGLMDAPGTCKKCGVTKMFKAGIENNAEAYRRAKTTPFARPKEVDQVTPEVMRKFRQSYGGNESWQW